MGGVVVINMVVGGKRDMFALGEDALACCRVSIGKGMTCSVAIGEVPRHCGFGCSIVVGAVYGLVHGVGNVGLGLIGVLVFSPGDVCVNVGIFDELCCASFLVLEDMMLGLVLEGAVDGWGRFVV